MRRIPLTNGYVALVDDIDYDRVSAYSWYHIQKKGCHYSAAYIPSLNIGKDRCCLMHHFILGWPLQGFVIDHRDGNGLNNQMTNLRPCTQGQNNANSKSWGASRYKGVSVRVKNNKTVYVASISSNRKRLYLGFYHDEREAALSYNKAATELHGEFAKLNIIT